MEGLLAGPQRLALRDDVIDAAVKCLLQETSMIRTAMVTLIRTVAAARVHARQVGCRARQPQFRAAFSVSLHESRGSSLRT